MTRFIWDKPGERFFQTGIDRGVLYLKNGRGVEWNGLTSVESGSTFELKSYYLDGVKYLDSLIPGDFSGKIKAITYPEEFDEYIGISRSTAGLSVYDQPPKHFNLCYRTILGNDLEGIDYGYKIHLLYNLVANPDTFVYNSLDEKVSPSEFVWTLSGTPSQFAGFRPTAHIALDSNDIDPSVLATLEDILYGTDTTAPRFPSMEEIGGYLGMVGQLLIIDNDDGTWTAVDYSGQYITMLDSSTFEIDNADVDYLDSNTYEISTTGP